MTVSTAWFVNWDNSLCYSYYNSLVAITKWNFIEGTQIPTSQTPTHGQLDTVGKTGQQAGNTGCASVGGWLC